jgi:hypothetical protein
MSLRPDHVEAARLGLGHGLFARLATRSRRKPRPHASRLRLDAVRWRYAGANRPGGGAGRRSNGECRVKKISVINLGGEAAVENI